MLAKTIELQRSLHCHRQIRPKPLKQWTTAIVIENLAVLTKRKIITCGYEATWRYSTLNMSRSHSRSRAWGARRQPRRAAAAAARRGGRTTRCWTLDGRCGVENKSIVAERQPPGPIVTPELPASKELPPPLYAARSLAHLIQPTGFNN